MFRRFTAVILIYVTLMPAAALASGRNDGDGSPEKKVLTEEQKIMHVLNRLGYGARPGDVERVKAMGLQRYIEQQLNPSTIDDSVAESKVQNLEVFNMTTAEVFAKYPNPGALLRQLEGGKAALAQKQAELQKTAAAATADGAQSPDAAEAVKKERQQKLRQIYEQYDLRPAGQLMPQVVANRLLRSVYSERQLQEVMVDFWQNHFNVYSGKGAVRWFIPSYERDVLRKNALGNFKDLLIGTAQHPAMLFYLDNFQSVSPTAQARGGRAGGAFAMRMMASGNLPPAMRERLKQRYGVTDAQLDQRLQQMKADPQQAKKRQQRGLNENYARELMELHTLGVDGGYTQQDIIEVAKAFSGWTIADPRGYRKIAAGNIIGDGDKRLDRMQRRGGVPDGVESGQFYFNEQWHEKGPKTVLGQTINAGGINDGLQVIDLLVKSPATAKFIAKKLAVRFVSDNPSDALVSRVADAFSKSGGDIKTTLRALFSDKEFFAPENYRAKIKTPFELAVSSIRALGADTRPTPSMIAVLAKLGELPYGYQAPTGYADTAEDWVNTGALLERLNFAIALSSNQIPGTKVDLSRFGSSGQIALDRAVGQLLAGDVSAATRQTLSNQIKQPLPEVKAADDVAAGAAASEASMMDTAASGKKGGYGGRRAALLPPSGNAEVYKAVSLVLGTPEFQRQ